MLNEDIMAYMTKNIDKKNKETNEVKEDVSEKEAMEIYNEIVAIFVKHNVSYQCACRLRLAMNNALLTGAVELYNREQSFPNGYD